MRNKRNFQKKQKKLTHGTKSLIAYRWDAQGRLKSTTDDYEKRHKKKEKWTTEAAK